MCLCSVLSHKFGVVQAHRTSSNPLKTHDIRERKVCRALSNKFGVLRAHLILLERARCVEYKALHTFLSLISCVLRGFDEVQCA